MELTERERQIFRLRDGRRLGYAEFGDPQGAPIFIFHGVPNSRLMFRVGDATARAVGARLIAPDRPGIGLSDPLPGRCLSDWPRDVAALADALGLERFAVAGVSGGGPYAVSCARHIPERLRAVGVISGVGPLGDAPVLKRSLVPRIRFMFEIAQMGGPAFRLIARAVAAAARRWPHTMLSAVALSGLEDDAPVVVEAGEAWSALEGGLVEAFRQGPWGPADDLRIIAGAWGFQPDDVRACVMLWHGEADAIVPSAMTRYLGEHIPASATRYFAEAGHLLGVTHAHIILGALARA